MYLVGKRCVGKVKGLYKEGAKTKDSRDIFNLKRFVRSLMHGPGTIEKHFPGEEHSCHLTGWADLKLAEETGHCHRVVLVLKARKTQKFRESRRPVEARVTNPEERPWDATVWRWSLSCHGDAKILEMRGPLHICQGELQLWSRVDQNLRQKLCVQEWPGCKREATSSSWNLAGRCWAKSCRLASWPVGV